MSLLPRRSRESRTRSPYVFMHIQISPPLSLSILSTSEILFFFNFLRRAFLRGRSGSSYVVASLRNRKSPARFPVASAFLTLYLGVRREEEEGGGMLSSLLITILCDSLSWFVTVARLKERSAGWGTRMALAWARRGATRTERRREKEREKKIGVLRSARKLVISWNEIFFSRVSLVAGSDRPRSPRDSSVRPAERSMDRQFRSSQSSERSADLLLSLSLSSRWISCYERQRRFTIIIFPVNYSDSLRGEEEDARVCVCTCTMYNVGIYLNVSLKSGNIPKYTF